MLITNAENIKIEYKGIDTTLQLSKNGSKDFDLYDRNMFFISHKDEYKSCKINSKTLTQFLSNKKSRKTNKSSEESQTYNISFFE